MPKKLGVYIHIPFCASKCAYCDFYSKPNIMDRRSAYTDAIVKNISEGSFDQKLYHVDTIYIGGGTPSYFGAKGLKRILKAVYTSFFVEEDAEITVEVNPDSAKRSFFRAIHHAGVNRVSIGVQSFEKDELEVLGRRHSVQQAEAAVAAARSAGISNVGIDLIYGVPGQTIESWERSLEHASALPIQHISCYALTLEDGTPLADHRGDYTFPDDDTVADMYLMTVAKLGEHGFAQYEISNFARDDKYSRHNMKYWTLGEYCGFGPSAHSFVAGTRYACISDIDEYIRRVKSGEPIVEETESGRMTDSPGEFIMLALRTTRGVNRMEFERRFHQNFAPIEAVFEKYAESGHAKFERNCWKLTIQGFLISNTIIVECMEALENSEK